MNQVLLWETEAQSCWQCPIKGQGSREVYPATPVLHSLKCIRLEGCFGDGKALTLLTSPLCGQAHFLAQGVLSGREMQETISLSWGQLSQMTSKVNQWDLGREHQYQQHPLQFSSSEITSNSPISTAEITGSLSKVILATHVIGLAEHFWHLNLNSLDRILTPRNFIHLLSELWRHLRLDAWSRK